MKEKEPKNAEAVIKDIRRCSMENQLNIFIEQGSGACVINRIPTGIVAKGMKRWVISLYRLHRNR